MPFCSKQSELCGGNLIWPFSALTVGVWNGITFFQLTLLLLLLLSHKVIVEPATKDMYIVDVNYFPGYNGMDSFHDKLLTYLAGLNAVPLATPPSSVSSSGSQISTDEDASASDSDMEMTHLYGGETVPYTSSLSLA